MMPLDGHGSTLIEPQLGHYIGIILCFSLVFLFSGLEAGLLSLNRIWLSEKVAEGNRRATILQDILSLPSRLIAVMLTMETTCSVVLAVLWTIVGTWYAHEFNLQNQALEGALLVAWGGLLLLLLVMFCEIVPKALFASNAERITMALAPVAGTLINIVYPIAWVLEKMAQLLIRIFTGKWMKRRTSKVTEEDLITMVKVGENEGVLEEQEVEMIHSIFNFGDLVAREIMVPRVDMEALNITDKVQDAVKVVIEKGHSRIPVYEDSPDHIKGLLFAKDILRHVERGDLENRTIADIMRPYILFVPGTKDLTSLLEEMRTNKIHLAVVMDEYGGTAGIVTIEDILEEIVGDIQDEYDKPLERLVEKKSDTNFVVDGKLGLHDFDDEIGVMLPEPDGVETVGGLLYQVLGRVPEVGDIIEIEPLPDNSNGDYVTDDPVFGLVTFTVLEVDENRIGRINICLEEVCEIDDSDGILKDRISGDEE